MGIAQVKLNDRSFSQLRAHCNGLRFRIDTDDVAHEEIAVLVDLLLIVHDDAEKERAARKVAIVLIETGEESLESQHRRLAI